MWCVLHFLYIFNVHHAKGGMAAYYAPEDLVCGALFSVFGWFMPSHWGVAREGLALKTSCVVRSPAFKPQLTPCKGVRGLGGMAAYYTPEDRVCGAFFSSVFLLF